MSSTPAHGVAGGNGQVPGPGLPLPSYAVGTPYVPSDQLAQVHQGEQIIPADQNPVALSALSRNPASVLPAISRSLAAGAGNVGQVGIDPVTNSQLNSQSAPSNPVPMPLATPTSTTPPAVTAPLAPSPAAAPDPSLIPTNNATSNATLSNTPVGTPLLPGQQYNNPSGTDPSGAIPYDGAQWYPGSNGVAGHWAGANATAPLAAAPAPQGNGLDSNGLLAALAQQSGGGYLAGTNSAGNALLAATGNTPGQPGMASGAFTQAVNASGSNQVLQMATQMLLQGKTPEEVEAELQRQGALYGPNFLDGAPSLQDLQSMQQQASSMGLSAPAGNMPLGSPARGAGPAPGPAGTGASGSGTNNPGATPAAPGGTITTPSGSTIPSMTEAPGNYTGGMSLSDYLDPSAGFRLKTGLDALNSTYGAQGNMLSGAALKGVTDYAQNDASQEYAAANQRYMADKGFNYGVDSADRTFNYNAAMNDQTIPFNQNLQLAQLGLGGAQSTSQLQQMMAQLLSQNTLAGGNASAAGSVGQGNILAQMIAQALQGYNTGQIVQAIQPKPVTTGP